MERARTQRHMSPAVAAVVLVFVLVLIGGTIWLLRLPLQLFIIAALVAVGISHPVNWLEQHRVPRLAAVIGMLALVIAAIVVLIVVFLPTLAREVHDLVDRIPGYWIDLRARLEQLTRSYPQIQRRLAHIDISGEAAKRLGSFVGAGWSVAVGVAGGIFTAILVVITIVFMLANPKPLVRGILGAVPDPWGERAAQIAGMIEDRVRAWLRGLVILGSVIGVFVGIGLWLLHVPYAVLFGILAGLLEMIPTVGPVLAAIPPILVALAVEPVKAVYVGLLFIAVQEAENMLLVPYVMRRQLQLHPVSTIFGFIAMGKMFGLFGAIIAVPTVACLKVLYDEIYYPWAHPGVGLEPRAVPLLPTAIAPATPSASDSEPSPPEA